MEVESEQPYKIHIDPKTNNEYVIIPHENVFDHRATVKGKTMWECFLNAVEKFRNKEVLGTRVHHADGTLGEFRFITFGEFKRVVDTVGSALDALGVKKGDKVGIFMTNCLEWSAVEFACARQGAISVPLYATYGVRAIAQTVAECHIKVIFSGAHQLGPLSESTELIEHFSITHVIVVNGVPQQQHAEKLKEKGIDWMTWDQLCSDKKPCPANPVSEDDLFTIIYTSGTTGDTKGAMITNKTATFGFRSVLCIPQLRTVEEETYYSYLPLAHVFERRIFHAFLLAGARIGYNSGSISNLMSDFGALKPTMIIGVPRVWKKIYDSVYSAVNASGVLARFFFNYAINSKLKAEQEHSMTWVDWDRTVLSGLQSKLGGRLKLVVSGGAPSDPKLTSWLKAAFGIEPYQGYGLTESFGAVFSQVDNTDPTNVGHLWDGVEGRVVSVPELEYTARGGCPRGELQLRGITVFSGYFNNEEATKETLSEDGWLATGDIVQLNKDHSVSIIDRKKNIFKLSQGEYIAVEFIENTLGRCPLISQIWIWGNSKKDFLVAVVVPHEAKLRELAKKNGRSDGTFEELCKNPEVVHDALDVIVKSGRESMLNGFQCPRKIYLESEPFTEDNGLMTSSFKLKRKVLEQKYHAILSELYDSQ